MAERIESRDPGPRSNCAPPLLFARIFSRRRGGGAGRRIRAAALSLLAPLWFACVMWQPANAASGRISIQSGGTTRTAFLVQQRRLKQARRPLIVILRQSGARERGPRSRRLFGLDEMSRSAGAILLYPDPASGRWSEGPGSDSARDVVFVRDLIASLVSDGLVDRRRLFLVGVGDGGFPALRLACEASPAFAGVAIAIGGMPADLASSCKPARPAPFMMIAATADPVFPFGGGKIALGDQKIEAAPAETLLAIFARAAQCGEGQTTAALPDRDPHDGSRAYLDRVNGCKVPVELLRIEGGGHALPGRPLSGETRSGPRNNDFSAARLIWDFFRKAGA